MHTFYIQLAEQLQYFAHTLYLQRQLLFDVHDGSCACDEKHLCAFHEHTFKTLVQVEKTLIVESNHLREGAQ